jgi:biopolymer transport protein ExbD
MADEKKRLLDVWILEADTVYREVPFVVVSDWLQQGRLLSDDSVRLAGSKKWHAIRDVPALRPYVPIAAPQHVDDRAEALEPVELGLDWRRPGEEDDEDIDMIPLIDISLVLLIFFMMTATVGGDALSSIVTPSAQHQLAAITKDTYWVGIDNKSRAGAVEKDSAGRLLPWFSCGKDNKEHLPPTRDLAAVMAALAAQLKDGPPGEVTVRLRAERTLPIETVKDATLDLHALENRVNRERGAANGRVTLVILGEVSEPKGR